MTYLVNEIFYTIQGEGYWTGRPAVFVRFSRCNLACEWCDTDFAHADKMTVDQIYDTALNLHPAVRPNHRMVVFTGGEPTLQLDNELTQRFRGAGWYTALETNGTIPFKFARDYMDWVCVSPKSGSVLAVTQADEFKVVWPQTFEPDWMRFQAEHLWLSPMDGPDLAENTVATVEYVKAHPQWRLNVQTHKVVGIR